MSNIEKVVNEFLNDRKKLERYASFDYCYNYFYNFYKNDEIEKIWNEENIEKSCLHLWFYLASWGMMRGSSFLLQKSLLNFKKLIQNISKDTSKIYWEIDVNNYNDENIIHLLNLKKIIIESFWENTPSDTLTTKIMLWIFGNIPAFDRYFKDWLKVNSVNKNNLYKIKDFYEKNKNDIDNFKIKTIDFLNWEDTNIFYTKAKIIDMFGFTLWDQIEKEKRN